MIIYKEIKRNRDDKSVYVRAEREGFTIEVILIKEKTRNGYYWENFESGEINRYFEAYYNVLSLAENNYPKHCELIRELYQYFFESAIEIAKILEIQRVERDEEIYFSSKNSGKSAKTHIESIFDFLFSMIKVTQSSIIQLNEVIFSSAGETIH